MKISDVLSIVRLSLFWKISIKLFEKLSFNLLTTSYILVSSVILKSVSLFYAFLFSTICIIGYLTAAATMYASKN